MAPETKKHDLNTCRDCAEKWRTAEVIQVLGYKQLSEDLVDLPCEANEGEPIEDQIEALILELAGTPTPKNGPGTPKEAAKEAKEYGPGGPPPFKQENREYRVTVKELETAMKLIQSTEDPGFMLKASRQVHSFIIDRLETLNKKAGFNEDGSVKTAKEKEVEASWPPRKSNGGRYWGRNPGPDTRPEDVTLQGISLFSVKHQKRLINAAKLAKDSIDHYVIRHFFNSAKGNICHQYVGRRADDCPMCGGRPPRVVLFPVSCVNKHGKPARNAPVYRESW